MDHIIFHMNDHECITAFHVKNLFALAAVANKHWKERSAGLDKVRKEESFEDYNGLDHASIEISRNTGMIQNSTLNLAVIEAVLRSHSLKRKALAIRY